MTEPGSLETPVCTDLPSQTQADFATATRQLMLAIIKAAEATGDATLVRDALVSSAYRNPSCETARAAWLMATPVVANPAVAAARRVLEILASQTRQPQPKIPVKGIVFGAGLLVVATALLVIPAYVMKS